MSPSASVSASYSPSSSVSPSPSDFITGPEDEIIVVAQVSDLRVDQPLVTEILATQVQDSLIIQMPPEDTIETKANENDINIAG